MKTKISIDQKSLKAALAVIATVVPNKPTMPILGDVLLAYNEQSNLFTISASDSEKWLSIEMKDGEGGPTVTLLDDDRKDAFHGVCINFRDLREAVTLLPSNLLLTAYFDSETHTMKVDYQIGEFTLPWEEVEEWPAAPAVSGTDMIKFAVEGAKIIPFMKQARVCVANEDLRPVMNCVCLDIDNDSIKVVSTDGHSLYRKTLQFGTGFLQSGTFGPGQSRNILVPKAALQTIDAAFAADKEVVLSADNLRMEWKVDGITLVFRLFEGTYPKYNSVIPQNNPYQADVDARSLTSALRRLNLFANDSSNMGKIIREGDSLVVEAEDFDFSKKGSERIKLINAETSTLPDGFAVGLKISKMIELLGLVGTEVAQIYFSDPSRASIIKEESNCQDLTLLIMPMLLN